MSGSDEIRRAFERGEDVSPMDGENGNLDAVEKLLPEVEGAAFPLNDYGNGKRLILYFGADMLFVPRLGWYRWQGDRWLADEDQLTVRRDAQKVAAKIEAEIEHLTLEPWERNALDLGRETAEERRAIDKKKAEDLTEEERRRAVELRRIAAEAAEVKSAFGKRKASHRRHAVSSGNSGKITNMLEEAKPEAACRIGDLNADAMAVNVANGTLKFSLELDPMAEDWGQTEPDWRVQLDPHNRGDLISKLIPVAYDPKATCPAWHAFLERVQPDPEMRAFLRRWVGYCLTGKTSEQKLLFNYGAGRNGKSTFVDTLAWIFADYGTTVPIETLTGTEQRKGSDATPDLVRLPGARFVRASEPEQGTRMKEAMIKALTGGEAIMIRRMMQEFVEVTPEFKLMISGNHKPEIRGSDDGIWRRVMLLLWGEQITDEEVDPMLPEKLRAEAPGILAWAVEGCLEWARVGLQVPAAVREATDEYRQESDKLRYFLQTECEITGKPENWTAARDIRDAFNAWMLSTGEAAWGSRTVAKEVRARAGVVKGPDDMVFSPVKRSDTGYMGIRVKPAAMDRIAEYRTQLDSAAARKG